MSQPIEISLPIEQYHGPKHPDMPDLPPVDVHECDTILHHQAVSLSRPLLHLKPSDPSTVKTAMVEAQLLSSNCGQQFVVITADQQIYKVIVDNIYGLLQRCSTIITHDWEDYTQS